MTASLEHAETELDYSDGAAFVEGEFVPVGAARIPVLDWGFLHSDVTYDVVHVWKGSFFRLEDHLDRFERSCSALRLRLPCDRDKIREILMQCVRLSALRDAYVEMVCTRGKPAAGSRDPRTCTNTLLAWAVPFIWIFTPEQQKRGGHLIISKVQRIPPESLAPTIKNFHWGDMTQALFEAYDRGAATAVLVDSKGNISEGPGFNVFCVAAGKVISPGDTVLEGITKKTVRELCAELEVPFEVGSVSPQELRDADEVFVSSTAGGIMPITRVDTRTLGHGRPGPLFMRLRDLYWVKHEQGWYATPVRYDT